MINSLFRRPFKFSVSFVSSSLFPGVPTSFNYITMEIHLNRYKDSPCVFFNFSFLLFDHSFVYWSSSRRLYMRVHQRNNSFSKCSLRFFSKELKLSSSCYPECNSFFRIIGGGIMPFLIIWVHVSWFTCCQEWGILNPSISSLELSWVIFHLKLSLRNGAIVVLINDPSFLLSSRRK